MGAVTFSIDPALVAHLREALPLKVFVETGTFEGETVSRMQDSFDEIHSIELSDAYFKAAVERFSALQQVRLHHGHSPEVLARLQPALAEKSVLFWLDAHWCVADDTAGSRSQCPLLGELDAIGELNESSAVVIDDARLFLATPPKPHEASDWPRLGELIRRLPELGPRHDIMVVNDVVIVFPESALAAVSAYARASGVDWLAASERLKMLEQRCETLEAVASERLTALAELTEATAEIHHVTRALAACTKRVRRIVRR